MKIYGEKGEVPVAQEGEDIVDKLVESDTYCKYCKKSFSNQNVFDHHLKGKRHIKAE
jgi:hypothetical protein